MDEYVNDDPIWNDLAALAFELLAKPDDAARDRPDEGASAADEQEGEP